MAAMTALICSALQDIYDLTDAWLWNGLSIQNSFRYLKVKRRLELFQLYCREVWLRESLKNRIEFSEKKETNWQSASDRIEPTTSSSSDYRNNLETMNRRQKDCYDFIRAESGVEEAFEVPETFGSSRLTAGSLDGKLGFDTLSAIDDIEVLTSLETDTSFYEYYDTTPVYADPSIGPLTEGLSFTVKGTLPYYCEKFSINFIVNNATKDIALHVNPRLPQNYIVRNTKVKGTWGYEEVSSPLPFTLSRGAPFSIQVLVTKSCYMISVNGHHFAEYAHRLPFSLVSVLEVKGDVENVIVEKNTVERYPTRSAETEGKEIPLTWGKSDVGESFDEIDGSRIPAAWRTICNDDAKKKEEALSLPYYGLIPPHALNVGRCLRVEGRVRLLPQSFYINLQQGQNIWPHPIIALHFNPRFTKQGGAIDRAIVCRNAWFNNSWDVEERSELVTDFRPGKVFCLSIVCGATSFEIYLNKKFMLNFRYRIPLEFIDTVYIQGDVKLWNVSLEKTQLEQPMQSINGNTYDNNDTSENPDNLQHLELEEFTGVADESFS